MDKSSSELGSLRFLLSNILLEEAQLASAKLRNRGRSVIMDRQMDLENARERARVAGATFEKFEIVRARYNFAIDGDGILLARKNKGQPASIWFPLGLFNDAMMAEHNEAPPWEPADFNVERFEYHLRLLTTIKVWAVHHAVNGRMAVHILE